MLNEAKEAHVFIVGSGAVHKAVAREEQHVPTRVARARNAAKHARNKPEFSLEAGIDGIQEKRPY